MAHARLRSFALVIDDVIHEVITERLAEAPPEGPRTYFSVWDDPEFVAAQEAALEDLRARHGKETEAEEERTRDAAPEDGGEDHDRQVAAIRAHHEENRRELARSIAEHERVLERVKDGMVGEVIKFEDSVTAEFRELCVEVTDRDPMPEVGWVRAKNGRFTAPKPYEPTPAQQMAAAVSAGCEVEYAGAKTLSATYDASGPRWERMKDEAAYIREFDAFSGGAKEVVWDAKGGEVTFESPEQLRAVRRAIEDWLTGWARYAAGRAKAPPGAVKLP